MRDRGCTHPKPPARTRKAPTRRTYRARCTSSPPDSTPSNRHRNCRPCTRRTKRLRTPGTCRCSRPRRCRLRAHCMCLRAPGIQHARADNIVMLDLESRVPVVSGPVAQPSEKTRGGDEKLRGYPGGSRPVAVHSTAHEAVKNPAPHTHPPASPHVPCPLHVVAGSQAWQSAP